MSLKPAAPFYHFYISATLLPLTQFTVLMRLNYEMFVIAFE